MASLPLKCLLQEFPNKTNHTSFTNKYDIMLPSALHPTFFGCFDWHSSVHGHWMLVKLLKQFPNMASASKIRVVLNASITKENILNEINYFNMH